MIVPYFTYKTIKYLNEWYLKKGVMFEFYDSENKKAPNELNRKGSPIEPYNFEVIATRFATSQYNNA